MLNPMLGKRCLVRTTSAGVHIGMVVAGEGTEVLMDNALRLWHWEGGALSLSSVASKGVGPGSRLDKTGNIYLTEAIEFIPTTPEAEATFALFTE